MSGTGCWLWPRTVNKRGYAVMRGKLVSRMVYEMIVGPIPGGHHLHHREECPKNCVNPEHVTPLTPTDHSRLHPHNNQRWRDRMRARTHCLKRAHELTPENTKHKHGRRICRACERIDHRIQQRAYRARLKEGSSQGL